MCYRIGDMGLCKLEKDKTYTLLEFLTNQVNQLNEVCTRLCEFRELVKEVVRGACRTALLEYGFMPDDYLTDNITVLPGTERNLYDVEELIESCKLTAKRLQLEPFPYSRDHPLVGQAVKAVDLALLQIKNNRYKLERRTEKLKMQQFGVGTSYISSGCDMEIFSDAPEKMTFTEMASKRKHCQRLTWYDLFHFKSHHSNSIQNLQSFLVVKTPIADMDIGRRDTVAGQKSTVKKPMSKQSSTDKIQDESKLPPLFALEIILEPSRLYLVPDESLFQDGILEIISKFQEQVFNIKNLTPDPYFDAFTRPLINNKFEEKTCGTGPQLRNMFAEDTGLQEIIYHVKKSLKSAFEAVNSYMNTFVEIHEFYRDNEEISKESIQTDYGSTFSLTY
ncbi:unnamed protein product [Trichobilharzia regenti]|nr:unnamed protein product [Trichobilharzia regenti]